MNVDHVAIQLGLLDNETMAEVLFSGDASREEMICIAKETKKVKKVSFYPSLDLESKSRQETQYAVATVHSRGKKQCKGTERLGDFYAGKKTHDLSR